MSQQLQVRVGPVQIVEHHQTRACCDAAASTSVCFHNTTFRIRIGYAGRGRPISGTTRPTRCAGADRNRQQLRIASRTRVETTSISTLIRDPTFLSRGPTRRPHLTMRVRATCATRAVCSIPAHPQRTLPDSVWSSAPASRLLQHGQLGAPPETDSASDGRCPQPPR